MKSETFYQMLSKSCILLEKQSSSAEQCAVYIKKWDNFCDGWQRDPVSFNEILVLEFLVKLFENRKGYITNNLARSALPTFLWNEAGFTIGSNASVKISMKGVFEIKAFSS